jgi:hypothetical protein
MQIDLASLRVENDGMSSPTSPEYTLSFDAARPVLRHLLATLAYRASKVLRDVPPSFGSRSFGAPTRKPVLIVAHLADLMAWGRTQAHGEHVWRAGGGEDWETEVQRFYAELAALDRALSEERGSVGAAEKLLQGPLADALTHVGQLAMLRGMVGTPVRPESYARAEIQAGRVGADQAPARYEFDGDASVGH